MQILNPASGEFAFLWTVAKVLALIGIGVYIVFAYVVVRQVKIMTDTIEVGYENLFKIFSYFHLLFSISVFLYALISL